MVARHPGAGSRSTPPIDPLHYLALLERKPGAIDYARPLEDWKLPGCFATLRRRLEADLGHRGTREFIKVLRLLEKASMAVTRRAVDQALAIGATGSDAIALILFHHAERPVGLFSLDGHPHLKSVIIEIPTSPPIGPSPPTAEGASIDADRQEADRDQQGATS